MATWRFQFSLFCSWRALRLQKCHGETEATLTPQSVARSREESLPAPGVRKDVLLVNEAGLDDSSDSDMDMEDLARAVSEASALASCSVKQNRGKRTNVSVRAPAVKPRGEDDGVPGTSSLLYSLVELVD